VYAKQTLTKRQATVFVSYTGRYLLRNFVEVLNELRGEYMWMDVFCVDQFAWTGHKDSDQVKAFKDELVQTLPQQITQIGRVALLLERWDDVPHTLNQIWVLWEIYNTVQVGAAFTVLLSIEELAKFIACIWFSGDGPNQAQKALADIRCQDATSEDKYVRQTILEKIEGQHNEVNTKVIEQVRKWYHQKGIEHLERLPIDDSPARLHYLGCFGGLLGTQGKLAQAEPLLGAALEGYRRLFGNDNPNTLASINNLAGLLREQGKLTEAEPLNRQALEGRRRVLGNDHPSTLYSINSLANLLLEQGKLTEAEPLYREALEGRRRVLGNDHRDTLTSIGSLAVFLYTKGNLTEAEPLFRQALEGHRLLANDHPETLTAISNCAEFLFAQGKRAEAEPLVWEALEGRRRLLGSDHPDTFNSLNNFAELLHAQGKLIEAEQLFRETLSARQ
jgi:hypothetical protein